VQARPNGGGAQRAQGGRPTAPGRFAV